MRTPPEGNWHYELITEGLMQLERVREVLFEGDSPYQHVLIQDAECFGRSLVLDDKTQSTELDEFVYHEALVQPAMMAHPEPSYGVHRGRRRGRNCKRGACDTGRWSAW